ncbi:MAG: hypothetical protein WCE61_19765 [Candidatus Acidiferrum sp.]
MKIAAVPVLALLLSPAALAQTPAPIPSATSKDIQIDIQNPSKPEGAVPLADEPHFAHAFQNGYVRVYNLAVPPLDATLLHRHDRPYIYLALGPADIVKAIQGKPEEHQTMPDGTTRYSPGGFAHVVRTDAGVAFHDITVVLLHPQDAPHNLGDNGAARLLGSCPQSSAAPAQNDQIPFEEALPCFETSEVHMDLVKLQGGKNFMQASPQTAALLIAMSNASLDVSLGEEHAAFLHAGDVLWLPAGTSRKVTGFLGTGSQFLLLSFRDSAAAAPK